MKCGLQAKFLGRFPPLTPPPGSEYSAGPTHRLQPAARRVPGVPPRATSEGPATPSATPWRPRGAPRGRPDHPRCPPVPLPEPPGTPGDALGAARDAQDLDEDAQAPTSAPSDRLNCWKYNKNKRFLMISRAACDAQRAPSGPPRALQKRPGDTLGSPQGPRGASLGPPGAAKEPPGTPQEPPSSLPERPESAQAPPEDAPDALGAARDAQDLDKDAHAPTTRPSDQPNCWKYYKNQRFFNDSKGCL